MRPSAEAQWAALRFKEGGTLLELAGILDDFANSQGGRFARQERNEIVQFLRQAADGLKPESDNDRFLAGMYFAIGLIRDTDL